MRKKVSLGGWLGGHLLVCCIDRRGEQVAHYRAFASRAMAELISVVNVVVGGERLLSNFAANN